MPDDFSLTSRLRNCLATILELEDPLLHTRMGGLLATEFQALKDVMAQLGPVGVCEADVERVEAATDKFLAELKDILAEASKAAAHKQVLQ